MSISSTSPNSAGFRERMRRLSLAWQSQTAEHGGVRLQTIVLLRWLAVAGQTAAVMYTAYGLGFPVPMGLCLAAIAASAWLNVVLSFRYPSTKRLNERQATVSHVFDLVQLAVLLYLTGGLENPFSFLFLVPVTIAAATLSLPSTLALVAVGLVSVTLLAFYHEPLPWAPEGEFRLAPVYLLGIWFSLCLGIGFMAIYAWRIAEEGRRMSAALGATQLVLAREQRLSALDGLAAAAAHELGTPLATISVVTKELQKELQKELGEEPQLAEDLALLHSQAERCRDILGRLTHSPAQTDTIVTQVPLRALLDEAAAPHRGYGVDVTISLAPSSDGEPEPAVWRRPELMYGLGNLVENAVDFATREVRLTADWDDSTIRVTIEDDGPGFSPEIIDKLGEPFVTLRPGQGREQPSDRISIDEEKGMGLGFFIAKTFLERTDARVAIANRTGRAHGARVTIDWPRQSIEGEGERPRVPKQ